MQPLGRLLVHAVLLALVVALATSTSAGAAATDRGLPERCAKQLGARVVGLACDGKDSRARLLTSKLRSGTRLFATRPLRPGTTVTVVGRLTRRSHVVLRYALGDRAFYVRFSNLSSAGGGRRLRITSRMRGSRLEVRAAMSGRARNPSLSRSSIVATSPTARPGASTPSPAASTPPVSPLAVPTPARNGLRPETLSPSGGGGCAVRDPALDAEWTRSGPGWTGADATYSVALPDGRDLWLFGDTLLGTVRDDGTRSTDSPFIRNSGVVRAGAGFETLHRGTAGAPSTWLESTERDTWYWPGDATVEGNEVRILLSKVRRTGPGMWDFAHAGTDIATLSLPGLEVRSIVAHDTSAIRWGAAVLEDGGWTYVYGMEKDGWVKHAHVARVRSGGLTGAWEYRTATGWSTREQDSVRVYRDVSDQFSVVARGGEYLLLTQESLFGEDIRVARSSSPLGGWGAARTVYTTPTWALGSFTYNALAHPQLSRDGDLVVSYNVNADDGASPYTRADTYRPRFVRIPATCL